MITGKNMFTRAVANRGAIMDSPAYEMLIRAIVKRAADDYKWVLTELNTYPDLPNWPIEYLEAYLLVRNDKLEKQKNELEQFFTSNWFVELTGLDGNRFMRRLQKEVLGE